MSPFLHALLAYLCGPASPYSRRPPIVFYLADDLGGVFHAQPWRLAC